MNPELITLFERQNPHLAAMFADLRGKPIKYFLNPGNAGDSLIATATYQLLDHYDLDYDVVSDPNAASLMRNETVLLAGGGNLVPLYQGTAALITRLRGSDNRIILLPHSIRGNEPLLAGLPRSATVYCREVASWEHVRRHAPQCDAVLGHDLALYADVKSLRRRMVDHDIDELFREMLASRCRLTPEAITGRELSCMRHGVERTTIPEGPNHDVAVVFQTGVSPRKAELGAWMLLEFTRLASSITTNRLHVGIAAALSGTPTTYHDNSYGKVSSIYIHSMQERFPHVTFAGPAHVDVFNAGALPV